MIARTEAGQRVIDADYRRLRDLDPRTFKECVEAADAIAINHNLASDVAAQIEAALVALAVRLLDRFYE